MTHRPDSSSPSSVASSTVNPSGAPRPATLLLGAPEAGSLPSNPHVIPLYQTVGYEAQDLDGLVRAVDDRDYFYARHRAPNEDAVARILSQLEALDGPRGEAAAADEIQAALFSSGMAAIDAALHAAVDLDLAEQPAGSGPRPILLTASPTYSATATLLRELDRRGVFTLIEGPLDDVATLAARCEALAPARVAVIYAEVLSNPRLRVPDLDGLATLAARTGARLVIDSTFATPLVCRPLGHGADLVVHSATKYLGGHGDVCAGVVIGKAPLVARAHGFRRQHGAVLDPFAAWLLHRGLRTLGVRVERQVQNAQALARFLDEGRARLGLVEVIYPGLPSHPDNARAGRYLTGPGPGAMLSFVVADAAAAQRVYERVRVIRRVASLGDVESLLMYPAGAWRRSVSPEEQARLGIAPGLLRLSVGIEAVEDLREDLERALIG